MILPNWTNSLSRIRRNFNVIEKSECFHFSPFENHSYLMETMQQSMAFRGSDITDWQRKLKAKLKELFGNTPQQTPI